MGDRFYYQQLEKTGSCPGYIGSKRRRKLAWTDETKQQAIDAYEAQDPTPETSMEIVAEIAEEMDESPNGVRMILSKAGVYVKKTATPTTASGEKKTGGRVSKAAAQKALIAAIEEYTTAEVDESIIDKLTGKAAIYFTGVLVPKTED